MPIVKGKHQISAVLGLANNPFDTSCSARQGQILKPRKSTGLQQKRHFVLAFAGFLFALGIVIILGVNKRLSLFFSSKTHIGNLYVHANMVAVYLRKQPP